MKKPTIIFLILFLGIFGFIFVIPTQKVVAYPDTIFFEDFEGSVFPEWTATGLWHLEDNNTSNYPLNASEGIPSPSHYMWFGNNGTGTYDDEENGYLTSPVIDLSSNTGIIEFTFASYKQMWGGDYTTVKYTNDGTTWHTIWLGVANNIIFGGTGGGPVAEIKSHSSTFQLRFCFDKDNTDGTPTAGIFGWRIDDVKLTERPSFDIWLPEDFYTDVGGTLEFYMTIIANFSRSNDAQFVVNITTPSGDNETIHDSLKTFGVNERWDFRTNPYTCKERGEYNLTVTIRDELNINHTATATCYSGDHVQIAAYPISGNYGFPGELIEFSCDLTNYYESSVLVDIIVKAEVNNINTTIYTETDRTLPPTLPDETYYYNFIVEFTPTEIGHHILYFEVTVEPSGKLFSRIDAIDVGPYFDIYYITDKYSVLVGESHSFDVYMDPHLLVDVEVNLSIIVETPSSGSIILFEESNLPFSPSGLLSETWIKSLSYKSLEPGYHRVETKVVNAFNPSDYWYGSTGWEAEETDPTLSITQTKKYPVLGDKQQINFSIQSHYASDIVVDISIIMTTPSDNEVILHEEPSTILAAVGSWKKSLSYTFDEYGSYEVEFLVVNKTDGTEWLEDISWRVREEEETTTNTSISKTGDSTPALTPGFNNTVLLVSLVSVSIYLHFQKREKN